MLGGSTRMIKAEGTLMISASRSTTSCHLWMISEGTWIELPNTIDLIESPTATVRPAWLSACHRRAGAILGRSLARHASTGPGSRYPHQRRTEKTGQKLCRQARSLRRDADLRPPRPAKARWKGVYHSLDRDVLREKGDARLVQIEGFDPEKVAILKPVLRSSA